MGLPIPIHIRSHRDGNHRLQGQALCVVALGAQIATERDADRCEHDVVERAAERVLDRLELSEVAVEEGVAPMRTDIDVERARRRGRADTGDRGGADAHEAILQLRGRPARCTEQRAGAAGHLGGHGRALEQSLAEQLGRSRQWPGGPGRRWARSSDRLCCGVEQDGGDVHAGDPVDERVVGLRDQGEAPACHALHKPDLPERLGSIQALGEEAPGQLLERGLVSRSRQGRMAMW